jgi:hypothetical protein
MQCKDSILGPGFAIEWDWNWDEDDSMHHEPGLRQKDLEKFIDFEKC